MTCPKTSPTFLVIDTNVWLHELALRSGAGSATRYFARSQGHVVVVPEVVRREVEKHLFRTMADLGKQMTDAHRKLVALLGRAKPVAVPDDEELRQRAAHLIDEFLRGIPRRDLPFSLDSARASLDKIMADEPPNKRGDQQFKDGVIWADCLRLLDEGSVYLVTGDAGFYHERQVARGRLATTLEEEARGRRGTLAVFPSLEALLPRIQSPVRLDEDALAVAALQDLRESVDNFLRMRGLTLGDRRPGGEVKMLATEEPARLYGTCRFRYDVGPEGEAQDGPRGVMELTAAFDYDVDAARATKIFPNIVSLFLADPGGGLAAMPGGRIVFVSCRGGRGETVHSARYDLEVIL